MAASTRGPILVAVIGALLAGGLAAVYFLYWGPKKSLESAQAEVEEFAPSWQAMRRCLIGTAPLSEDIGEAIILRELTTPEVASRLRECESLLVAAKRKGEFRTDNDALEKAWEGYRLGRSKLAKALAHRTARRPRRSIDELRRHLADGARAAEDAYRALRSAVELDAEGPNGNRLPAAARAPLTEGLAGGDLAQLELDNNRIVAIDASTEVRRLFVISNQGVARTQLRRGVFVAAAPPPGWGVTETDDGLAVTSLAAASESAPVAPVPLGKVGENVRVVGAIGSATGERIVVTVDFLEGGRATLYHSPVEGAPFVAKALPLSDPTLLPVSALDLAFRRLIVQSPRETLEFTESELAVPRRLRQGGSPCYANRTTWWQTSNQLTRARGAELTPVLGSEDMPWQARSCDDAQVLGVGNANRGEGIAVRLCSQTSCPVATTLPLPAEGEKFVLIAPKRGPIVATAASGMLLVWAPDDAGEGLAPHVAVDLGDSDILGLVEWNDQLSAVVRKEGVVELARLE